MKKPDEQIATIVLEKLKETKRWNLKTITKISTWITDGNANKSDLIFLIENQREDKNEAQ